MLNVAERPIKKKATSVVSIVPVAKPEAERIARWFDEKIDQSKAGPFSEVVNVTPALAQLLLARNAENRGVSEINLDRMKRDILSGHFLFNGESIVVSKDGFLNDGQHRARAVAETGIPVRMVVVFGVERDTRMTVDQGNVRTVGHFLGMTGHSDANALSSTANYAWQFKQFGRLSHGGWARPTKTESLLMVEHYRDIADSLQFVSRARVGAVCTRTLLAFCHWAISQRASSGVDAFFDALISGAALGERDPILYCRNRLIDMRGSAGSHNTHERAELIFRAWNHHRLDEKVNRIVISGKRFPELER